MIGAGILLERRDTTINIPGAMSAIYENSPRSASTRTTSIYSFA